MTTITNETYDSVAATFGFDHHEGTSPELELEVLKCILIRERLISSLKDLVRKTNANPRLIVSSCSSFSKNDTKQHVLKLLTECHEVTANLDFSEGIARKMLTRE